MVLRWERFSYAPQCPARARRNCSGDASRPFLAASRTPRRFMSPSAEGALLEDVDGNTFIDLAGGIGCLNVGHRNSSVTSAIHRQVDRFLHTCAQVTPYEDYITLAEAMNRLTPGGFAKKTLFVNTGVEAVENAVKIARAYTRRPAIVCFEDAFHGRTLLGMALTSKTHPYKAGFEPFPGDIYRMPYAYCYRCAYGKTYPSCQVHCASQAFDEFFRRHVASETVAAIIVEPVLGEGGFVVPPPEFFAELRDTLRQTRHRAYRRRSANRIRPHRRHVCLRALRTRP